MAKANKRFGVDLNIAYGTDSSVNIPREFIPLVAFWWGISTVYGLLFAISIFIQAIRLEQIQESFWRPPGLDRLIFEMSFQILFIVVIAVSPLVISIWVIKIFKLKRGLFDAIGWASVPIVFVGISIFYDGMMSYMYWSLELADIYGTPTNPFIVLLIICMAFAVGGIVYYRKQKKFHILIDLDELQSDTDIQP